MFAVFSPRASRTISKQVLPAIVLLGNVEVLAIPVVVFVVAAATVAAVLVVVVGYCSSIILT